MTATPDALTLAQALIRCPSVTPEDAGALAVIGAALATAGFTVERPPVTPPGLAPSENLKPATPGSARGRPASSAPATPTWCLRATRRAGATTRSLAWWRTAGSTGAAPPT